MDDEVRHALRQVELAGKQDELLLALVGKAEDQNLLRRTLYRIFEKLARKCHDPVQERRIVHKIFEEALSANTNDPSGFLKPGNYLSSYGGTYNFMLPETEEPRPWTMK